MRERAEITRTFMCLLNSLSDFRLVASFRQLMMEIARSALMDSTTTCMSVELLSILGSMWAKSVSILLVRGKNSDSVWICNVLYLEYFSIC